MTVNRRRFFSYSLAFIGILLILFGVFRNREFYNSYSFEQAPEPAQIEIVESDDSEYGDAVLFNEPARLQIEQLGIDLKIEESSIENGVWQVSDDGVSFLDRSAKPSQGGNIVLYGHNKKDILGTIYDIRVRDVINIYDDEGSVLKYEVEETFTVTPDEVSVVQPTDYEVLTLYTCIGPFDSKRFIVKAKPVVDL